MKEDNYHAIFSILDQNPNGPGFSYELKHWNEVGEGYRSNLGAALFSSELHEIIEGLVGKGYLKRNPDDPIEIVFSKPEMVK